MSEYEHSGVEFAKEQSDISSDELYEVEKEIEISFDLETFVTLREFSVVSTSIPHIFARK